mmetsp:Transcript_99407/g.196963  ORF Transcript_99407/g.196963 Transcript_99407/m.196963 type:complete len:315 (+) Transcript_99407:38-982(+)
MESIGAGGILALKYCSATKATTAAAFAVTAPDVVHEHTRPLFETARNVSEQMVNNIMKMKPVGEVAATEHAHDVVPQETTPEIAPLAKPMPDHTPVQDAITEHEHVGPSKEIMPETAPLVQAMPDHESVVEAMIKHDHVGLSQETMPETVSLAKTMADHTPVHESHSEMVSSFMLAVFQKHDRCGAANDAESANALDQALSEASSGILEDMLANSSHGSQKDSQLGEVETIMQSNEMFAGHASNQVALQVTESTESTVKASAGKGLVDEMPADRNSGFIFVKDSLECVSVFDSFGQSLHQRRRRRCCFDIKPRS